VVHWPFLCPSSKVGGPQLGGVGAPFVGVGPALGGEVCELRGEVMELLPEVLVFLRDGCDRLGYPAQLM